MKKITTVCKRRKHFSSTGTLCWCLLQCALFPLPAVSASGSAAVPQPDAATAVASSQIPSLLHDFLNLQLWVIDGHAVQVKNILIALLIIIIGLLLTRYIRWFLANRFLPRTHLSENAAAIFLQLFYYFLLLMVFLFALRLVNIPLTAFTFLGGALAIGVGFGAQNILNNFISGFIIMAERPIRIGDLIEIENRFATVEEIGVRCTRIRTADNIHILVPNSTFLDQNITNVTLSDKRVRVKITVGVIYGSPVRAVERLLNQSANDHPDILTDPAPYVRFTDFGDNALIFEQFFWISMVNISEHKRIASDVRFSIDELFRQHNIIIAFPQRDVHLDSPRAIDVRIVDR